MNKGEHKIYNLIGARSKDGLYIVDSFKKLSSETMIATEDGSRGIKGLVTDLFKKLLLSFDIKKGKKTALKNVQIYTCGPEGMMDEVSRIANSYKIPCQVSLEQWMGCGVGICRACVCRLKQGKSFRYATVCTEGPVFDSSRLYL